MAKCPRCGNLDYIPPKCGKCGFNEESDVFSGEQQFGEAGGDDQRKAS